MQESFGQLYSTLGIYHQKMEAAGQAGPVFAENCLILL
jgi:hypothetical protein